MQLVDLDAVTCGQGGQVLNYVPVELDSSEQAPASIILNDIYPFQVTVMSLAIEFGTFSFREAILQKIPEFYEIQLLESACPLVWH